MVTNITRRELVKTACMGVFGFPNILKGAGSIGKGGGRYTRPLAGARIDWGHTLADKLIGCWNLLECTGLTTIDNSGVYGNGVLLGTTNTPEWQGSARGKILNFISANAQYVQIPDNPGLRLDSSYSVELLFLLTTLRDFNGIFGKTNSNVPAPFDIYVNSAGTLRCFPSTTPVDVTGLGINTWYHCVMTVDYYDPGGVSTNVYLNGSYRFRTFTGANADGAFNIRIGNRNDNATLMNGQIAYARIWRRVLKVSDVEWLNAENYAMMILPTYRRYFIMQSGFVRHRVTN